LLVTAESRAYTSWLGCGRRPAIKSLRAQLRRNPLLEAVMKKFVLSFLLFLTTWAAAEVKLLRHPSYHNGKVAFSYLGDIWWRPKPSAIRSGSPSKRRAMSIQDSRPMENGSPSLPTVTVTTTFLSSPPKAVQQSSSPFTPRRIWLSAGQRTAK